MIYAESIGLPHTQQEGSFAFSEGIHLAVGACYLNLQRLEIRAWKKKTRYNVFDRDSVLFLMLEIPGGYNFPHAIAINKNRAKEYGFCN